MKRAKAIWLRHGAQELRFSQIFTGEFTGQYIVAAFFSDMAAYAKASASAAADMQAIYADNAKMGAVLQEREIVVGIDI